MAIGPEKRNDLPNREVVAHAAGEAGALVDEYYEGAEAVTHQGGVCQTPGPDASQTRRVRLSVSG